MRYSRSRSDATATFHQQPRDQIPAAIDGPLQWRLALAVLRVHDRATIQQRACKPHAKKSTGPTSAEGRAKSSLNASKTGLTGQTVLLPTADPAAREALIRGEIFLAYRRDLNNLALQERRLRNQHKADVENLQALQTECLEKKNEKSKIQARMLAAIRSMFGSRN